MVSLCPGSFLPSDLKLVPRARLPLVGKVAEAGEPSGPCAGLTEPTEPIWGGGFLG